MFRIFISYRRQDARGDAGRLADNLGEEFGEERIFRDIEDIEAGTDFVQAIDEVVANSEVLLAVIGPNWLDIKDEHGKRCLDDPRDFVRLEIALALKRGIRVVPILVGDASMPSEEELPEEIRALARRQAFQISYHRWHFDVQMLLRALDQVVAKDGKAATSPAPDSEMAPGGSAATAPPPPPRRKLWDRLREFLGKPDADDYSLPRDNGSAPPSRPPPPDPLAAAEAGESKEAFGAADLSPVLLGASAPQRVRPGDEFTARFLAYIPELESELRAELARLSPRSTAHLGLKSCQWRPGTRVNVKLSARSLRINPSEQEFLWEGSRNVVEFDVAVAEDAPDDDTVVLKFDALIDGIAIATVRLDLQIARRTAARGDTISNVVRAARTAFASYCSQDRQRVLDRLAAVRISAGLDIFLDCLSLNPGEQWKPRLANEIRQRDLFLLFWSLAASESEWVGWEWRTALAERGKDIMQIHPLEAGIKPPEELKELHFDDFCMAVRTAYDSSMHSRSTT